MRFYMVMGSWGSEGSGCFERNVRAFKKQEDAIALRDYLDAVAADSQANRISLDTYQDLLRPYDQQENYSDTDYFIESYEVF